MRNFILVVVIITSLVWGIFGCAPLPPLEEEEVTAIAKIKVNDPLFLIKSDSMALGMHRSFAYGYYQQNDFVTARAHYDTVRTYDIKHWFNIYRRLADSYNQCQLPDSAVYAYEEGIKYFPDDDYLRTSLSYMYKNLRQYEKAVEQQLEALRIKPDEPEYLKTLAELYLKVEDYDNAISTYEKLVEKFPDDAELSNTLSNLIRTNRNPEEWLLSLKESLEKFPDDLDRRFEFASALLDQGNNKDAVKEFEIITSQNPTDPKWWRGLGESLDNLEETLGAIAAYKKLVNIEPDALDIFVMIGKNYLLLNRFQESRTWAMKALKKNPDLGSAWLLLGDIFQKTADMASGDIPKYNDKLVFTIAYGLYQKARNSKDPEARIDGDRAMKILKSGEFVPTIEDKFMHSKENRPTGNAYAWINHNWDEVKYIDTYLKNLDN